MSPLFTLPLIILCILTHHHSTEPLTPSPLHEFPSTQFIPYSSLSRHCLSQSESFSSHGNSSVALSVLCKNYAAAIAQPPFFPLNAHFQHDYFTDSLHRFYSDALYRTKLFRNTKDSTIPFLHAPLLRPNYLIISAHPWDPIIESYLPNLSHAYFKHFQKIRHRQWDVLFYSLNGIRKDADIWSRISTDGFDTTVQKQDLVDFMESRIGSLLPLNARFESGHVFWMRDGAIVAEWDQSVDLSEFIDCGLRDAASSLEDHETPMPTPQYYSTVDLERNEIASQFLAQFHHSVQRFVRKGEFPERKSTADRARSPILYKQHEKTIITLYLPSNAVPPASSLVTSYLDILASFQQRNHFKFGSNTEFEVRHSNLPLEEIRLEKVVIEFDNHPSQNASLPPSTSTRHDSLTISNIFMTTHHRITTINHVKPPAMLFSRWLSQVTRNWIIPFNAVSLQNQIYSDKRFVVLFLDDHDMHQWYTLRNRMISFIVSTHQNHVYLRNHLIFFYAKQHNFSEYLRRIMHPSTVRGQPCIMMIDPSAKRHYQCTACLDHDSATNNWSINQDAMIAFLYDHISREDDPMGSEYFFMSDGFSHHPTSLPYHESTKNTILNATLLHSYQEQSRTSAVILYFYVPMCSHCLKFFHDLSKFAQSVGNLEIFAHDFYRSNISSTHEVHMALSETTSKVNDAGMHRQIPLKDAVNGFPSIFAMHNDHIERFSGSVDSLMLWVEKYHQGFGGHGRRNSKKIHVGDKKQVSPHDEL
mmetsp:Transcript_5838/g.22152  ORF Transcript_5838/g.22152 Transcript_5838/m.22152 type:complete len:756 (-) Transcript_5838:110-2377(-)